MATGVNTKPSQSGSCASNTRLARIVHECPVVSISLLRRSQLTRVFMEESDQARLRE
ncbi:hypothetical protein RSSM_01766 [Rhodopirellula sallentina SM41]|uniref:Uncharacterized protein n=1 Tax=Rhodopirellula sallentina SM41 TaxID=1263870 RepID=M5ULC9_9BACT|nr:hypothetical protein RSSM_01766 [Rhodopirellula sallentina SM41]